MHKKKSVIATFIVTLVILFTSSSSYAEDSNRNEVRAKLAEGGWSIVYGDLINEGDYLEFIEAVAEAVAIENPAPIYRFFDNQLQAQIIKIRNTAPEIAQDALIDLLLRAFDSNGDVFTHGNLEVSAGLATYRRWETVIYDEPRTYQCKQNLPFGGWTWSVCTTTARVEKELPLPNNFQPYFRFRWHSESGTTYSGGHQFYLKNACHLPIRLALRYRQPSGEWYTNGYWNFAAGEGSYLALGQGTQLRTDNSIFYYYAEAENGTVYWSGKEYRVFGSRSLPMREVQLSLNSNGAYQLTLYCNN